MNEETELNASQKFDRDYAEMQRQTGENKEVIELGNFDPVKGEYEYTKRKVGTEFSLTEPMDEEEVPK